MKVDQPGRRAGLETREHSVMTDYLPTWRSPASSNHVPLRNLEREVDAVSVASALDVIGVR